MLYLGTREFVPKGSQWLCYRKAHTPVFPLRNHTPVPVVHAEA